MNDKPLIVNILGGPGIGKSTVATAVFSLLKMHEVNAEYVSEFAKDLTWEERFYTLLNQYYVWANQHHRIWRLKPYVDVIITDSPTILSMIYGSHVVDEFRQTVLEVFNSNNNMNFLLERITEYVPVGRNQNQREACTIDKKIKSMLVNNGIKYSMSNCSHNGINNIVSTVLSTLGREHIFSIGK